MMTESPPAIEPISFHTKAIMGKRAIPQQYGNEVQRPYHHANQEPPDDPAQKPGEPLKTAMPVVPARRQPGGNERHGMTRKPMRLNRPPPARERPLSAHRQRLATRAGVRDEKSKGLLSALDSLPFVHGTGTIEAVAILGTYPLGTPPHDLRDRDVWSRHVGDPDRPPHLLCAVPSARVVRGSQPPAQRLRGRILQEQLVRTLGGVPPQEAQVGEANDAVVGCPVAGADTGSLGRTSSETRNDLRHHRNLHRRVGHDQGLTHPGFVL